MDKLIKEVCDKLIKDSYEARLSAIIDTLDVLVWDVIDEIGDLDNEEHELQPILSIITDMYIRYERDIDIACQWSGAPLKETIQRYKDNKDEL